ncbi:hypothetical protein DFH28DRAFT_927664 [Melampsora americana]|nr:hypothetical protein DFH28DRAFT_927664 [Melampsora americana]
MAGLDSNFSNPPGFSCTIDYVDSVQFSMLSPAKVKKQPLMTGNQFETWAEEALKFPVEQACVSLKKRYHLIKRACQQIPINNGEAQERQLNNENDAEEIEIIVDKLSKLGKFNSRIDHIITVFCLLDGLDKHVLLTPGNINKWAKAIHNPEICGVDVRSPLQEL